VHRQFLAVIHRYADDSIILTSLQLRLRRILNLSIHLVDQRPVLLSRLRPLELQCRRQQLILDTTMPPAINDSQLKSLLAHWPKLKALDFGPGPDCLSEDESKAFESGSCLTFQALDVITTQGPNLAKLRLPITSPGPNSQGPSFNGNTHGSLTQLTLTGVSAFGAQGAMPYLRRTFPSLQVLDGLPDVDSLSS